VSATARPQARVITVVIADDDPGVLAALGDLIGDEPGLRLVGSAPDAATVIDLVRRERPDVVVLDVWMPGGGIEAARELRRVNPDTAVVALSYLGDRRTVAAMSDAGAVRFLVKGSAGLDIVGAIVEAGPAGRE